MTRSTFSDIIGLDSLDDTMWNQASMKIKFGGFGLTEIQQISPAAFITAWAQSVRVLPIRLTDSVDDLYQLHCQKTSIGSSLEAALASLPPTVGSEDEEPRQHTFTEMVSNPKKLQHQLSTDITLARASEYVDSATSDRGAWLDTIPTSDKNALKPSEFCLASYLRIGQPLPYSK